MTENTGTAAPSAETAQPAVAPAAEPAIKPIPAAEPKPKPSDQALVDDWLSDDQESADAADAEIGAAEQAEDVGEKPAWARPDDPEQAKEWREERGIPDDPDGYEWELPEGAELDGRAQETLSAYGQIAHSLDLSTETANKLYGFVREQAERQIAALADLDQSDVKTAKEALHQQWGDRADSNLKSVKGLFKELPTDVAKAIREARLGANGSRLSNNPGFLALLADYAALKSGQPSVGAFDAEKDTARIAEIRRTLKNDIGAYYRDGMDAELPVLLQRQASQAPAKPTPLNADGKREQEILAVLRSDADKYYRDGLDKELIKIRARRGVVDNHNTD